MTKVRYYKCYVTALAGFFTAIVLMLLLAATHAL